MGVSYERRPPHYTDEPEPYRPADLWRGLAIAIPLSILMWALIVGLGYLGYIVGGLVR